MARRSIKTMALGEYSGITLRRQRVQNLLLTENRFPPNLEIPEHSHIYPHFTIMLEGGFVERYSKTEMRCDKGDILVVPEGQSHTDTIGPSGAHSLSIEISRSLVNFLSSESDILARPMAIRDASFKFPILNLKQLFLKTENPSPFELHSAAMQVILSVFRASAKQEYEAKSQTSWLPGIIRKIERDPSSTNSMEELARVAGVSPAHLSRTFRQCTGVTVGEYIRSARLANAVKALEASNESIAVIAAENGFCDHAHFTKCFKQAYCVTPTAYRANIT